MKFIRNILCLTANIIWPISCHICGVRLDALSDMPICTACAERMRRRTLKPSRYPGRHFRSIRSPYIYEGAMKEALYLFKYDRDEAVGEGLARLLCGAIAEDGGVKETDAIVPVPLHRSRLRKRTYNQAGILANALSRRFGIPVLDCLKKHRATPPQTTLSGKKRQSNVKDSFIYRDKRPLENKRLLLIDDVYTTGSTVDEASRILKRAGARSVDVLTAARSL